MITAISVGDEPGGIAQQGDVLSFYVGWSNYEFRLNDPPKLIQLVDQQGNNMPEDPPVFLTPDLPGFLAMPATVANGELSIYALGEGVTVVTAEYIDPVTGPVESLLTFTVVGIKALTPDFAELFWGDGPATWGDSPVFWG